MIESRFEHQSPIDDLRLAEIECRWEECREELAGLLAVAEAGDDADLRRAAWEADVRLNHFLEEVVPELIIEIRRRNKQSAVEVKHG